MGMTNNIIRAILINACILLGALLETPERKAIALYFIIVSAILAAGYIERVLKDD